MSAWVQVLDFTKSWSTVTVKMTENVGLCFVYAPYMRFITYMCVYHFEFDALHQLSVKKGSFGNTLSKA